MEQKELLTVIVADDETELREAVCSMIPWKEIGFRLVGSAGNGLDALQLVEQLQPGSAADGHPHALYQRCESGPAGARAAAADADRLPERL